MLDDAFLMRFDSLDGNGIFFISCGPLTGGNVHVAGVLLQIG